MKLLTQTRKLSQQGFSLIELLVVVVLLTVLVGGIVSQINVTQQRSRGEQAKLDIFQESRDFVDQFVRDAHEAGYPSYHMFDTGSWATAPASPIYTDSRLAAGVILIGPSEVKFEGDVEGDGNVDIVDYNLVTTGNNCPCLQRSAVDKTSGVAVFSNEVQNVQSAGTTADPIFVAYTATGTAVTTADLTSAANRQSLATIKTILIRLKTKANILDPQTQQAPECTLSGQVTVVNCSLTANSQANSCLPLIEETT
jgi:prepilin-type N-terminal cleavage/methylation domain-containing protein